MTCDFMSTDLTCINTFCTFSIDYTIDSNNGVCITNTIIAVLLLEGSVNY